MNSKYPLLYSSLMAAVIFGIFHFVADSFYFYWTYWWSDMVMHFLAGVVGGLATYSVLFESGLWRRNSQTALMRVIIVLFCVMTVGVAWEWLEYINGMTYAPEGYLIDTLSDLVLDGLGALIASLICARSNARVNG